MTSVQHAASGGHGRAIAGTLATRALSGAPMRLVPSGWGGGAPACRDESWFLKLLGVKTIFAATDRVARLQRLLRDADVTTAAQLGEALGLSPVQLKRLCQRLYGVTPKSLLIRHRLARMLVALEHRPYGELRQFLDLGYCDQSHFIRDFKAFFGMPPTRYFAAA